jgi:hypothetical protein
MNAMHNGSPWVLAMIGLLASGACSGAGNDGDGDGDGGSAADGTAATGSGATGAGGFGGNGGSSGNGSGGFGAGVGPDGMCVDPIPTGCNDLHVEFESVIPTVVLLVDRSSSMFDLPLADSPNRWEPLKTALVDPTSGVVTTLQDSVRFGFTAYTHQKKNGLMGCPLLNDAGIIGLNNYDAIKAKYDEASVDPALSAPTPADKLTYKGETPTGAAVRAVTPGLLAYAEPGPKFILLVTDGEPDTCVNPDPQCGQDESVAAVQEARAQGIGTFVIGVGEVGAAHLQDLANAGAGQPVQQRPPATGCPAVAAPQAMYSPAGGNAPFYNPQNPTELASAVAGIIASVRGCTYTLNHEIDPSKAHLGTVQLECSNLPIDDGNGWRVVNETEVELTGNACATIRSTAQPRLYISFPCDVIIR